MHNVVTNIDSEKPEPAYQARPYDELLSRPIRELGLMLAGSPVERFVEQLYRELSPRGFAVLGFPCNQFGAQEPGDAKQIAEFCEIFEIGWRRRCERLRKGPAG